MQKCYSYLNLLNFNFNFILIFFLKSKINIVFLKVLFYVSLTYIKVNKIVEVIDNLISFI